MIGGSIGSDGRNIFVRHGGGFLVTMGEDGSTGGIGGHVPWGLDVVLFWTLFSLGNDNRMMMYLVSVVSYLQVMCIVRQ